MGGPSEPRAALNRMTRRNTSSEEQAIRVAVVAWMEKRRPGARVIHELALGERRVDLAFVFEADIVGVEIKGPKDSLSDGRLALQMREFGFYLPEVWLAMDRRWWEHDKVMGFPNLLIFDGGSVVRGRDLEGDPMRDELCCSRILERLWTSEARAIALRLGLVQPQLADRMGHGKVLAILARLLSGQEIMREVCRELRSRPLTGAGSDPAHERAPAKHPPAMPVQHRGKP